MGHTESTSQFLQFSKIKKVRVGSFLIYSLILSAVIQGKFYSFISSPLYESQITNLEQLVDSKIPIKFSDGLKIIFMFNGPTSDRVLKRYETLLNPDLLENSITAYNENFATVIDRGALIMNPSIIHKMQMFHLFSFETCFLVQSKHILFEYFDKTLQRIIECGFMEKMISDTKFHYSLKEYVKEENKKDNNSLILIVVDILQSPDSALKSLYIRRVIVLVGRIINPK
ncbi:hypothetical protein NQ317_003420 [Molorchus minor]|uniref:Uncharacterized protein n=1 Tax=Molorchus minor TaxID=1323400 RepID=A0ABQ9JVT2_9CUCU|nr:hypothetical protein NQ317_003420 [Molorchus minor]